MVFDYPDFTALSCIEPFFFGESCEGEIDIMPYLDPKKKIFFFSSHSHPDHFNPRLKEISDNFQDSRLILSKGILDFFPDYRRGMDERMHFLEPGDFIEIEGLRITAMPSTDIGMSLFIEHKGVNIFFPGDLALWLWKELDKETKEDVRDTFERVIRCVTEEGTDILFVVMEPNLRELGWGGAVDAVKTVMPSLAIPIHLRGQHSLIYRFKRAIPQGVRVFDYNRTGDYYEWEKSE